ncbi:MAG: PQQ-dependent sugar dehydrogenase [Oceanococcus sp.]
MNTLKVASLNLALLLALTTAACKGNPPLEITPAPFQTQVLASNLDQPWGLAFLPKGGYLITQKPGQLIMLQGDQRSAVDGVPEVAHRGQGGLLDVALHPQYSSKNNWVYLSYSDGEDNYGTSLGRGRLSKTADGRAELTDWQLLFQLPKTTGRKQHFGSRIVFDRKGYLFLSIGDRGDRERAQDISDPAGSILRLNADGSIPKDNPYITTAGAHPALYSIGHRNPQGLALHPSDNQIWELEHGPQGGDELNALIAGNNYGWPTISYGEEYGTGFSIGVGTEQAGLEQPLHYWKPSIAPSGLAFYQGTAFPDWQGDILVGALKFQTLVRLRISEGKILEEIRYQPLAEQPQRIRDVRVGADGMIYLLTDSRNGQLLQLIPN